MTDNYQVDKNSKLFQKFLALKANKPSDSASQPYLLPDRMGAKTPKNKSQISWTKERADYQEEAKNQEITVQVKRATVHVTVDDIEEAASILSETIVDPHANNNKQQNSQMERAYLGRRQDEKSQENYLEKSERKNEEVVIPKNERNRERRTRDFQQKPRGRIQTTLARKNQEDTSLVADQRRTFQMSFKPQQLRVEREKQNVQINSRDEEVGSKIQENNFTLGSKEGQYRKKYEKLAQKYEQMKETLQQQRRQRQNIVHEKEAQLEVIKEKYFELRSNQDTLTTELKRFKDKLQNQNLARTKFQQEVKELNFRILELQEMLQGKEGNFRKKADEVNHWKSQNEQIRSDMKQVISQIQQLQDRSQFLQSENKLLQRDISNKQHLIAELRKNMSTIIEENNIAKDEIYKLTIRLYHTEHQNQSIKGDLQRRQKDQSHHMNVIQDNYQRSIQNFSPKKSLERLQRPDRPDRPERSEMVPQRDQRAAKEGHGRRREFARERATTKLQKPQKGNQRQQKRDRRVIEPERVQSSNQPGAKSREIVERIHFLQAELQVRSKQKSMTGRMRKQKIEMQRELQQLMMQ